MAGSSLTASTGVWGGSPTSYRYAWLRCDRTGAGCSTISNAVSATYLLVQADVGATLRVTVTAANAVGSSSATSAPTSVVINPSLVQSDWWASTSPFNTPIPPGAALDPNSQTWISALYNNSLVSSIYVNSTAWTTTVYHASSSTPHATFAVTNTGKHITIPYASNWVPSPDSDAHFAVIDDATGCEYEFQSFNASALTAHAVAVFHVATGSGAHVADAGVTGGEMSLLGGLITPQDVAAGAINHALRIGTPVNSSAYRLPATRSDGNTQGGIPEGALLRLDPNLDLSQENLTPFQLMLARALQQYGAYDDDNAGALAVYAESTADGSTYSRTISSLPKSFVSHLEVLAPLFTSVDLDSNSTTTCNTPT